MPNAAFHHKVLLPANLSLWEGQAVLSKLFENHILIGIDEAGRGPLAGPVVAGAAIVGAGFTPALSALNDSKKLSAKQR